jgi:hypothetical protein
MSTTDFLGDHNGFYDAIAWTPDEICELAEPWNEE